MASCSAHVIVVEDCINKLSKNHLTFYESWITPCLKFTLKGGDELLN